MSTSKPFFSLGGECFRCETRSETEGVLMRILVNRSALIEYLDALERYVGEDACWEVQWWSCEDEIERVVTDGLGVLDDEMLTNLARDAAGLMDLHLRIDGRFFPSVWGEVAAAEGRAAAIAHGVKLPDFGSLQG